MSKEGTGHEGLYLKNAFSSVEQEGGEVIQRKAVTGLGLARASPIGHRKSEAFRGRAENYQNMHEGVCDINCASGRVREVIAKALLKTGTPSSPGYRDREKVKPLSRRARGKWKKRTRHIASE